MNVLLRSTLFDYIAREKGKSIELRCILAIVDDLSLNSSVKQKQGGSSTHSVENFEISLSLYLQEFREINFIC